MEGQDKWADTFPRLYELYCNDPSNPANYFNSANTQSALKEDPPDQFLTELESILEELDPEAWQQWKERAAIYLSEEVEFGHPLQLFDAFNEARAYVYLKRQGCADITFVKPGKKKSPDLLAKDSVGCSILLEAKRIHDSDNEIEYLCASGEQKVMRDRRYGLDEALETKLKRTYETARKQLLTYTDERGARRIIYLSIRIDSINATTRTDAEVEKLLTSLNDDVIETVYVIENSPLL